VLEHVSEAAFALGIVGRAGVHESIKAEDRGLRALTDDEGKAVGKDLHRGALLEAGEILRTRCADESYAEDKGCEHTSNRHVETSRELPPKVLLYRSCDTGFSLDYEIAE